jgi:hypothetical protein
VPVMLLLLRYLQAQQQTSRHADLSEDIVTRQALLCMGCSPMQLGYNCTAMRSRACSRKAARQFEQHGDSMDIHIACGMYTHSRRQMVVLEFEGQGRGGCCYCCTRRQLFGV